MTRLFLHAGTHKTGTTAIQTFAMHHRAALLERGLLFPTLEPDLPGRSYPHHVLAHTVAGQHTGLDMNRIPDLIAHWREMAERTGADVLISAEPIYRHVLHKGPQGDWIDGRRRYLTRLARLLEPFEVEPVLVFRRPEDFARSSFQERVMKSSSAPWRSFAEFRDQAIDIRKYFRNAKILREVFGNLRVMTFEDLTQCGPVPQTFFRALGVDVSDLDDGGVVRESLDPRETAVKLALIRQGYPPERNAAVLDWLRAPETTARIDAIFGPGPFGIWESAAALEAFRARTAPRVERLRAAFFPDRAALFPAPRTGPGPDPVPDHPAGLDDLLATAPISASSFAHPAPVPAPAAAPRSAPDIMRVAPPARRVLLHAGMPKTGSSALQSGLHALQKQLLAQGYLYPDSIGTANNHSILSAGLKSAQTVSRNFKRVYGENTSRIADDLASWIAQVRKALQNENIHTLILSSEAFFSLKSPQHRNQLKAILAEFGDCIDAVVYLRRPSEHYISAVQQGLKASHLIKPLKPTDYQERLKAIESMISGELHVIRYEPRDFPDGNILTHFLETFCPEVAAQAKIPTIRRNVSLSAEGMAILQDYRKRFHGEAHNVFTPDTERLIRAIRATDAALGGNTKPRALPEIAEALDQGSPDLLWLRRRFGIVFDGIDYNRIARRKQPPEPEHVAEICALDPAARDQTLLHLVETRLKHPPTPDEMAAIAALDPVAREQTLLDLLHTDLLKTGTGNR